MGEFGEDTVIREIVRGVYICRWKGTDEGGDYAMANSSCHRNIEQRVETMREQPAQSVGQGIRGFARCTWVRQSEVGTCQCIVSLAIDCEDVAGTARVGAGLVGEDGRLEIKRQGEILAE